MDKEEAIKKLSERWPDAEALRKEFSGLSALLSGEFARDKFNVYEFKNGIVVSRPLNQGLIKNPTIGIISLGDYKFSTGENIETMTVFDGLFEAGVDDGHNCYMNFFGKYGSIMVPAGMGLKLRVTPPNSPTFYLCQYKPKK